MSMVATPVFGTYGFTAYGGNHEAWMARNSEVILYGPNHCGKTRTVMEKIHLACNSCDDVKILLLRKRSTDLAGSALETYRDDVAGNQLASGEIRFVNQTRDEPARYEYRRTRSTITLGGLWPPTQATKITSSSYDIVCVIEAAELTEADWELLIPLCSHGVLPVNQLIGETRPKDSEHWIVKRAERGQLRLIEGRHEDNPRLYRNGVITPFGRTYLAQLDGLTGVNKLRNRHGRWADSEGQCIPSFKDTIHVIDPFQVPYGWPQWWSIDFGKVHPFTWGQFAVDPGGRGFLIREISMTGRETEDHCRQILQLTRHDPVPIEIITDHSANDRLICERMFGRKVLAADKSTLESIDYLEKRFAQGRLYIFRNSLVEVDQSQIDKGHVPGLAGELPGVIWADGKRSGKGALKVWDDSFDMARYWAIEMDRPEEWEVSW